MEIWMDVVGYEGYYQISNTDKVRSLKRRIKNYPSGTRVMKSVVLKTRIGTTGYFMVDLSKEGKSIKHRVHRLKAKAFIPNPNNYPEINHIDGDKLNNHLLNLEWCTSSQNRLHAYKEGLKPSKLSNEDVDYILKSYPEINIPALARKYGVSNTAIWYVLKGKNCKRLNK